MVKRFFYPYCGYRLGYCLKKTECKRMKSPCRWFRAGHPITRDRPEGVGTS